MKRLTFLALSLLPLAACSRDTDNFRPRIVIEQPEAGRVSRSGNTVVRGYAFDDRGIDRITVNGRPLYVAPQSAGNPRSRGQRIRRFSFQSSGTQARLAYVIEVTDTSGLKVSRELPLTVDSQKPTLSITLAERRSGISRISGVASDNVKVRQILVGGSRLEIQPASKREFYIEVPQALVVLTAIDTVGNQTSLTVGPLPELNPPEPPPVVGEPGVP